MLSLYHPLKGLFFEEHDEVKIAESDVEYLNAEVDALIAARDLSVEEAEAILRVELGSKVSEMKSKEPFKEKLTAIIPLIKKENLHFMVQKLSEIGVSDFVFYKPDLIDQSIAKKDHLKMLEKCEEVIINACKQCGSNFLPGSQMYLNINDAIDGLEDKTDVYVFDIQAIETFKANEVLPERDVCIISGPESGFSESELETFKNKDLKMRIIGNNVLRAETAPIVISTLVLNQFDRI